MMVIILKEMDEVDENDKSHPYVNIFKELWPILRKLLENCKYMEDVVDEICSVIKYSMRVLDRFFDIFLKNLVEVVVNNYKVI